MHHLRDAGTIITASPDQAKRLRVTESDLLSLMRVSETQKSSIDEKDVDLDDIVETIDSAKKSQNSKKDVTDDSDQQEDEADSKTDGLKQADAHLLGKFVELCDLLPPLPQKGTFEVETIKGSQYFFS
jgi:DNA-directed RNA polymerase, mitochondrial